MPLSSPDGDDLIVTARHRVGRRLPLLEVRGRSETEILGLVSAMVCDRVHWDTVEDFDARALLDELPQPSYTRRWSDGQHRVWVPEGSGYEAREIVRQWCGSNDVQAVNIRVESSVPFRDVDRIPDGLFPELVAAAVEWLFPRIYTVRRQLVAEIDGIDDEDIRSMLFLFVSDHADRYDMDREGRNGSLNFLTYLIGKLRSWPMDLSRTAYGRGVVNDRQALRQGAERFVGEQRREPTEAELADSLGMTVTDLRRRSAAIASLSHIRDYREIDRVASSGDSPLQVAGDDDVPGPAEDYGHSSRLTMAVLDAVDNPAPGGRRPQDPLGLAAVYLAYWDDLSKADVARELEVLPKTASAAITRVLERAAGEGIEP